MCVCVCADLVLESPVTRLAAPNGRCDPLLPANRSPHLAGSVGEGGGWSNRMCIIILVRDGGTEEGRRAGGGGGGEQGTPYQTHS